MPNHQKINNPILSITETLYEDIEIKEPAQTPVNPSEEVAKSEFITKLMNAIYDPELNKIDKEIDDDVDFRTLKKELRKTLKKYYNYFNTQESIYKHLKQLVNKILAADTTTKMKIIMEKAIRSFNEDLPKLEHERIE